MARQVCHIKELVTEFGRFDTDDGEQLFGAITRIDDGREVLVCMNEEIVVQLQDALIEYGDKPEVSLN